MRRRTESGHDCVAIRDAQPGARIVAFGDPFQAINAFRGADAQAFAHIVERFRCRELPLTVSFRCARSVVERAARIVPYIEASETASEGKVKDIISLPEGLQPRRDVVLCRTWAPLISTMLRLLSQGVPSKLLRNKNADIEKELGALIRMISDHAEPTPEGFIRQLKWWKETESDRATKEEEGERFEGSPSVPLHRRALGIGGPRADRRPLARATEGNVRQEGQSDRACDRARREGLGVGAGLYPCS